ncbi:ABC transporter ATP-binding protein [Bacillus sp. AGMB 02131]|uniref:ABC transporter ATP-binding protein n=1 Tax=Peribacillus faecalis TaxID=2772559 RepID=A0A927CV92_9BACI|nr:ABC transporter ATP-binding protein [Peribacillus faecalis]MBD3107382.1 ABC transporter ATP-binding protein [Peribacillus faecalis]
MITLHNVTGGYNKENAIVRNLSLTVEKGSFFALLGPNGSGKTTIIRLMLGVLSLHSGDVIIDGKNVKQYKPKELAKKVAVMTQEHEIGLDFTVKEIVATGRYPYQNSMLFWENSKQDEQVIEKVMRQTNIWKYRDKSFTALSGGEKQRVLLAKALAQEPTVLLLDEPTNHLDIRHSMELLDLLKHLQHANQLTILAILHDLNIASLYADHICLLRTGELQGIYDGFKNEDKKDFSEVYEVQMEFQQHPKVAKNQIFLLPQFLQKNKKHTLKKYVSVQKNEIVFKHALRTISVGQEGRGIDWAQGWSFTNESVHVIGYNAKKKCCEIFSRTIPESWSTLMFFSNENNNVRVGFVTEENIDDIEMMNSVVQLTSFMKKYSITEEDNMKEESPFSLLTISSCNYDRKETRKSVIEEMQQLWLFGRDHSQKKNVQCGLHLL